MAVLDVSGALALAEAMGAARVVAGSLLAAAAQGMAAGQADRRRKE